MKTFPKLQQDSRRREEPSTPGRGVTARRQVDQLSESLQRHADHSSRVTEGQAAQLRGGLPEGIRGGLESMSGMDLSDVRVHYNSSKPAALQARAYAQGRDIHLGPGQERHLPHEGWHVVQQRQGRVRPTLDVGGVPVNDDPGLEAEADRMGSRATQMKVLRDPE